MSLYGRVFAAGYDTVMKGAEKATFDAHRRSLLADVRGRVIEIGGGTGANLPYYGSGVEELVITEPEEPMAQRLERLPGPARARGARARRGPAGGGRPLRLRGVDPRAVHGLRSCARAGRAATRAEAARPARLPRACPLGRPEAREVAGPPARAPVPARPRLQLQPRDALEHRGQRIRGGRARARHGQEGAADRPAADRRGG